VVLVHHPRPAMHARSLGEEVRSRLAAHASPSLQRSVLVAAKTRAERHGGSRYWSPSELRRLLADAGYDELVVDSGRPIIVLARRPVD
jgi:hypothetical protein